MSLAPRVKSGHWVALRVQCHCRLLGQACDILLWPPCQIDRGGSIWHCVNVTPATG